MFNFLLINETSDNEPQIDSLAMKCREGQTALSLNCKRTFCRPLENVTSLHSALYIGLSPAQCWCYQNRQVAQTFVKKFPQ